MIKNERQYRITKSQADKFERALAQVAAATPDTVKLHPLLLKAQREALTSQLADLNRQLADYNSLRSGERRVLELTSFDDLPRALIQARIALGLSQKDLADRLGLKEQQLQRYEASDYASASLDRVKEIIKALGLRVREDVILPDVQVTSAKLFKQLREVGFDRTFVLNKLIPKRLAARLGNGSAKESEDNIVLGAAASVSRVLGCSIASLFGDAPLQFDKVATSSVRYKVATRANERRLNAYTLYAVYLALLTLEATSDMVQKPIPTDATEFRTQVVTTYGSLSFETVLRYLWSLEFLYFPLKIQVRFMVHASAKMGATSSCSSNRRPLLRVGYTIVFMKLVMRGRSPIKSSMKSSNRKSLLVEDRVPMRRKRLAGSLAMSY